MTINDVKQRVECIRSQADTDWERAHGLEDALFLDVLIAIARGSKNAKQLAKTSLESKKLDFARRCA